MKHRNLGARLGQLVLVATLGGLSQTGTQATASSSQAVEDRNPVLDWNQILVESLVETSTANSSSQRLCAIVHTAMFDAENGIERRVAPIRVQRRAPRDASRQAAIVAAAYTTLVDLFPSRKAALDTHYARSLAALNDHEETVEQSRDRGIEWGIDVAREVLAWRANDGFGAAYPAFRGGTAVGQWRPTLPALGAMSALGLAFTSPFAIISATQFQPPPPRPLSSVTYAADFNAVKALGRDTGSTRTADQTALGPFWEGNASVHWNQAANQIATARHLSTSDSNRLFAALNLAMADTAITIWTAKRRFGDMSGEATWRPVTAIPMADSDLNPATAPDSAWMPLVVTPSHPEYPAGHPALNGAAATVLLSRFADQQTFTLTTRTSSGDLPPRRYDRISQARADGNDARVWGGMHYPSTVAISDGVGAAIATYIFQLLRV